MLLDNLMDDHCIRWAGETLVGLYRLWNYVIFGSCLAIPGAIASLRWKRPDLIPRPVAWMFGSFIVLCGTTHMMSNAVLSHDWYTALVVIYGLTAIVSVAVASMVWIGLGDALMMHSAEEYRSEVTQRSRVEQALDLTINAIVMADMTGTINHWNRGAENIFGYSKSDALGQSITMIVPEQYRRQHLDGMARLLGTGRSEMSGKILEMTGLRNTGKEFPIEITISVFSTPTKETVLAAFIRDITERKRVEAERLKQIEELSRAKLVLATPEGFEEALRILDDLSASLREEMNG